MLTGGNREALYLEFRKHTRLTERKITVKVSLVVLTKWRGCTNN